MLNFDKKFYVRLKQCHETVFSGSLLYCRLLYIEGTKFIVEA